MTPSKSREGMVVAVPESGRGDEGEGANGEDSIMVTETSPLTAESLGTTTISSTSGTSSEHLLASAAGSNGIGSKRRKSRRSPRQASEARLENKIRKENARHFYTMAFKEATQLLQERRTSTSTTTVNSETTEQLIIRLNEKYGITNENRKLTKVLYTKRLPLDLQVRVQKRKVRHQEFQMN